MANIRRLKSLRAFLDTVPKERFNLNTWAETPITNAINVKINSLTPQKNTYREDHILGQEFDKVFASPKKIKSAGCRTTACALGWAAVKPSFRAAGLHFSNTMDVGGVIRADVKYEGAMGLFAGAKFFAISQIATEYLFFPGQYGKNRNLSEVKRRLDVLIRNNGKAPAGRKPCW